ncbi:MAG: ribonuclease Z [Bacteroidota bacterium]
MRFELTILGCNAAIPAYDRHPSAQVLNVHEQLFLIDCGEGTQIQMNRYRIRRSRIQQIFISHLHGDHIFGLIGLLTSYSLSGRTEPLTIFSPAGLEEIIQVQLQHTGGVLAYPLNFELVDCATYTLIFANKTLEVYAFPLRHRIPTSGYLFREKPRLLNIIPEQIQKYQIPIADIPKIKAGEDYVNEAGRVIANAELTLAPAIPRSYAYCSDTIYDESLVSILREVDLLYHETTFCHDKVEQAIQTMHTTAKQAAQLAQKAGVGRLITGHYSSRYPDLTVILTEAQAVFERTVLGLEGKSYPVAARRRSVS